MYVTPHFARALAVATAGDHYLLALGPEDWGWSQGLEAAQQAFGHVPRGRHLQPCPCGHLRDPIWDCLCQPRAIKKYRIKHAESWRGAHIVITLPPLDEQEMGRILNGSDGPPWSQATITDVRRVRSKGVQERRLTEEALALIQTATQQFGLTLGQVLRVLAVAQTISNLEDTKEVEVVASAEAVQYHSFRWWAL